MISYAILGEAGVPVELGRVPMPPAGAMHLPQISDVAPLMTMMWADGLWVARPTIAAPVLFAPETGGQALNFGEIPAGTVLRIIDVAGGDELVCTADFERPLAIVLVDAGDYLIELCAPLPWMPFEQRVAVR